MFSHIMVGSNDIDRSQRFYDAVFGAAGGKPARKDDKGRIAYVHNGGIFMVSPPIDGQPATRNHSSIGSADPDDAEHHRDGPATNARYPRAAKRIERTPNTSDATQAALVGSPGLRSTVPS